MKLYAKILTLMVGFLAIVSMANTLTAFDSGVLIKQAETALTTSLNTSVISAQKAVDQTAQAAIKSAEASSMRILQVGFLAATGFIGAGCCVYRLAKYAQKREKNTIAEPAKNNPWIINSTKFLFASAGLAASLALIIKAPALITRFSL